MPDTPGKSPRRAADALAVRAIGLCLLWAAIVAPAWSASQVDLKAITDFKLSITGFVPYLVDKGRQCVEIDAKVYRNRWAAAECAFQGQEAVYKVNLTVYLEQDGESSYKLVVDGQQVGSTLQNPRVKASQDHTKKVHTWNGVRVRNGAKIQVQSNSVSNGLVPEGSGFGWARGKWLTLSFVPATTGVRASAATATGKTGSVPQKTAVYGLGGRQYVSGHRMGKAAANTTVNALHAMKLRTLY